MNKTQISKANVFNGMAIIVFSSDLPATSNQDNEIFRLVTNARRTEVFDLLMQHDFGDVMARHVSGQVTYETKRIAIKRAEFMGQTSVVVMHDDDCGINVNANVWTPQASYSAQSLVIYNANYDPFLDGKAIYDLAMKTVSTGNEKPNWSAVNAEVERIVAEREEIVWNNKIAEMRG